MRKIFSKTIAVLALLGTAMTAGAPAASAADPQPITIGFAIAESGWLQNYDAAPFKAAVLKIDEINKAGGLLGHPVTYRVIDTKTDRERSASAGNKGGSSASPDSGSRASHRHPASHQAESRGGT